MTKIDTIKYQNAILYFIQHCNNEHLGATKLNKLVYYLDFLHYRDAGKTVTGDIYTHKQYGPVPNSIDYIINLLQKEDKLAVTENPFNDENSGHRKKYETKVASDTSCFDKEELKLLQGICKAFEQYNTQTIVAQTHLEAPWFYSKPHETIDYEYAKSIDVKV